MRSQMTLLVENLIEIACRSDHHANENQDRSCRHTKQWKMFNGPSGW
jgi:hypothetical protein